jgi:hypothetical protein
MFDSLPEVLRPAIASVRDRLEEQRRTFPYAGDRACTVDGVELLSQIGQAVLAAAMPDPDRRMLDYQKGKLEEQGLGVDASG